MNKTRMGKRVASLLLSLVMMLSLLPTAAYAAMGDADETQGASVSENGTRVSDDSNSGGDTGDLQVGDSEDGGNTGDQKVEGSNGSNTVGDTAGTEGGADPTDSVNENDSTLVTPSNRVEVNGTVYDTLEAAIAAAEPVNGVITYEIYGKVEANSTESWIEVLKAGLTDVTKVAFVGKTDDAEISITNSTSVLADQNYDIDVSFVDLTLSHSNGAWVGDIGHATEYFTCVLRNTDAANNTVTYTNCTFPNGACNNQYGKTVFVNCEFTNTTSGKYNLWNYGGTTEITKSAFTGTRGIKTYNEGTLAESPEVAIKDTTFTGLTEKAAIVASKPTDIKLDSISATECTKGVFQKDIEGSADAEKVTIEANGSGISGNFNVTAEKTTEAAKDEFNITAGSFTAEVPSDYCAEGFTIEKKADGSYGVKENQPSANVAKVGDTEYATLGEAIAALSSSYTLELLDESAWDVATPVYWAAGSESGYVATLADALTAAYMANAGGITIVCRPGTDVGKLTHGHVADNITIYGNNAYISSGECDLEVDTYMFSRDTGKQVTTGGAYLDKDITVTAYELDNLGVWGQRHTGHKVTVNLTDCDSVHGITVQRVYISGTTGVNDITLTGCDFGTKATSVYSNADGKVVIDNCSFTGAQVPVNFNHKANGTQTVTVQNSKFTNCGDNGDWKQFAAPVRFVNSGSGTMNTTVGTCTFTDTVGGNGDILLGDGREGEKSNNVSLTVENTAANVQAQQPGYYAKNGTTDESKQGTKNVAADDKLTTSVTQLMPSSETTYVAEVNGAKYKSLQAAVDAAKSGATVTLLADTRENVTVSKNAIVLDLNGHTLNGGTENAKPALTVDNKKVTLKDSSEAQTGTIKREDTADTKTSHYVIDIQGKNGFMIVESGKVENNSGIPGVKGSSLIRLGNDSVSGWPTLTIKGGTFTQDNFIAIKVDRGTLHLLGGTVNSANSFAIENWNNAYIKGGTVNGTVSTWVYSTGAAFSKLEISGGTVNGNVASVNYDNAADKQARVYVTGGTVTGTLGTYTYNNGLVAMDETAKATIEVTGGTFSKDPTQYVVEDSAISKNDDGTYGVAKTYLAKIGDTEYYTMDEAFHAVKAGETIVMLRDYTTNKVQNSGDESFTIDLGGHTWTANIVDTASAAFEINYSDVTLTVKNGKVVSSQLAGLIPSAMSGTITYNNSELVFDGVEMTANGHSGIETNGSNTNDTVTLKNSTLNVPNGYGIYFPSSGTLTIDNSVINAKTMGVQVCSGSLNISGAGTAITVTGDGIAKTENDGAIEDGAAISIVERTGYKGLIAIKVESGTFTAKAGNDAVKAYKWDNTNKTESAFDNSKNVVAVSGGTFSSAVDKSLCADGYIPTQNADGTFGVKVGADGYVEDENGNVTISTAEGLFYFAKKVNAGNNFAGKTVTLANNIDLNNEKWTPIGIYGTQATWFKGTFDGQNHAVTGLKVEESRKNGVGFFSKVYTGTIKNLTVEGSVSAPGCTYVGGIVGHGYATITNCTFKGTVSGSGAAQVGGIAGSGGFTVDRCSVYGDVSAGCWAGGIVGNCQDGGAYTNCYVEGTISSESTFWGGGAAGITPVPLYPSQVISGCYSNTVVKVAGEEVNCPIIAAYNNPLDYKGYSGGLKIYDNSWNKQKNSNDSYPIYAEKDGKGGVLMEGMTAARDNSLIMLEDDLNYVTGDLSKVRIMAGSSVTQAQIDALAVASVGDSKYQFLTEAINAAQDGQTVRLLADVAEDVVISKSIALDLGGKTLTNTNAGKATISVQSGTVTVKNGNVVGGNDYYNIEVTKGSNANLTLTDVAATAGNTGSSMIDNWGTLTITSGTYTGGLDTVKNEPSAKLNITGGTFTLTKGNSNGFTGVVFNYGELTISGGEFIQSDKSAPYGQAQVIHTDKDKNGSAAPSTVITGGTFKNLCTRTTAWTVRATNAADGATKVSGGAFNKEVKDYYCADGFIPTKNADGTYGVKEGKFVAEVGSKKYETLADAIRLATKGKTVKLLADVEQNTQLTINKSITLDLNGKTIRNTVDIWGDKANAILSITNGAKVTITGNGTIDAKENDCYTINVAKGDLTIENGTFYGNVSVVQVEEGTLSVKGGTFDLHQKWEGSSKYLFNCIDSEFTSGNAKVAISGGTFVGFDPNVSPEQKVDGKTPSFAAPGVGITKNENGSFTAAAGMTAQILDKDGNSVKAYNTLAEAVAAAQDGQTVRLLADVTLNEQIATGKAITIDGQSKYTIKTVKKLASVDGKAGMFYRTQSAKGTLTFLNVTLDGGGVSKIFLNEGGAGETVFDGVTSTNGGGIAYGSGIHISGGGSHATIRNSTLTGSTGTMELNDANYYAANDLWVGGNVYVTVENSVIGNVFVNSAPSATATNGVVHGQLTITGEKTKITYLSGEEEAADKLDKFGNNGSLVKIDSGYVEKVFDKGSYAISGGTFKTEVKKEWCAAGYVPTQNGDGTYGVAEGKFTVQVTSRTTGSDSPVANVAGGGSDITYAVGTTVTASAISGYKFVGWFVNEYTGTAYSTDLTCEVKPTDDWTMIAVYEPISGGKFWLNVTASEFTVNGGAVQDSYLYEQFAVGASVTVNFTGSENFLYWVNASNKVVSTEKSYTFVMGSETTLKAVYGKARQNQATVVFISHSDQIISSKAYTTNDTIQFPVPPIKMGCTFTGWSMTEAEIRAAMANNSGIIQVRARYTEPSIACKVTVIYPDGIGNDVVNAVVGKAVNVTAKDIEGKTFSYWTDNAGNVLGYTKTLNLAPSGDMTVKAVYDEAAEAKPVITISEVSATTANESYVVTFMATRAVPDGYKVVKQGILWSRDAVCGEDGAAAYMQFDSNGKLPTGVNAYIGNSLELNGVTRLDITTKYNDRTFYGRGYMVLESDAGELLYIYTNTIESGSYDSLTK